MAKAKPAETNTEQMAHDPKVNSKQTTKDVGAVAGTTTLNPPIPTDKELIEKAKVAQKEKDQAAKDAKAKEKADAKAAKDAANAEVKAAKAAAKATAKAEREARLAELAAAGKSYTGSMLALADKVKSGVYVKSATGQLRSNNELAVALDGISATDVVRIGLDLLKLETNPYYSLNVGQQSMNLRNRMRGAIKKNVFTLADVAAYIERNKITVTTVADVEAKAKAKAEKKAEADRLKAEKAAVAKAKPAENTTAAT